VTQKLGHVWRLEVGAQVYEGLDLRAVARHPRAAPATCDLVVYHGGPVLEEQLSAGTEEVRVLAGYRASGPVLIARGYPIPRTVQTDSSSQDRPTEVQISASRGAARTALLSAAWVDVSASEVLRFVAESAGLELDARLARDPQYPSYAVQGGLLSVARALARDCGCELDVGAASLRLWPAGEVARITAEVWSPSTGLRSASATGTEIAASALLTPALRPGDSLRLLSERYSGDVLVHDVVHEVDTYGGTWYTSCTGVPRG
jgi:hypothetical protein